MSPPTTLRPSQAPQLTESDPGRKRVPMARPLLLLAIVSPLLAHTQTCQGGACPPLPHRIAERLAERLSDEELATTILELLNACDGRTNCAQSMEQQAAAAVELNRSHDALDVPPATAEVNGMDTRMPSTGFRLLFGTPLFSTVASLREFILTL